MLAMLGPCRRIVGVDYDAEKIGNGAAQFPAAARKRSSSTTCAFAELPEADAFLLLDVLQLHAARKSSAG